MSDLDNYGLNEKLRRLIETIDLANLLTEPLTRSINDLLSISAGQMRSAEASVLVKDGEEGDLRFLCAIGQVAEQLLDVVVPAGKGIAGFVLSSGQPMAVSDVGDESSFFAEIDKATGFSTQTILATPLRHNGEVIGVLEYINRIGDPPFEPFTPEEMDIAAGYGDAIASLVSAYDSAKIFRDLGQKFINDDAEMDIDDVRQWLGALRGSTEHREMMEMAVMLREIASRSDAERRLCYETIEALLRFSNSRSETSFLNY